ncbi:3,4-dihydroxy 2-butanone 4-phosphate synthase / GTP cyclohydrolase II [Arboricoccus pini]|uniref:3,4-dihydroxy-2-butanone 4-phosphate synthase n=1 Tax=Arboricoccus pini TaxID=1963835 RepID=A0A212QQF5_9PROT|nr:3,4-dihydroxy-2-butanone-4-phosphate synthase [Arboricoccus pini]SNB61670.1 3,4-dihydroxy 2-butanone 4-phosphate synthase / GTP cyclohydrolase II [Arboricoccus pini]
MLEAGSGADHLDRPTHPGVVRHAIEGLTTTEQLLVEARAGRMVILVDDETAKGRGALIIPADAASDSTVTFMAMHGRGLICLALTEARCRALRLERQPQRRANGLNSAFTVSIEARTGVSTGISAADRARTIAVAIDRAATQSDLVSPGHVFPLAAKEGGVLAREGSPEAAVDLARLAGRDPSGVICEVMTDDGDMATLPDLLAFGARHGIKIGSIADLVAYRLHRDRIVEPVAALPFASRHGGHFELHVFADRVSGKEHLALVTGDVAGGVPVPVGSHDVDLLADVLGGDRPTRETPTLPATMAEMAEAGRGVIILVDADIDGGPPREEGDHPRLHAIGAQILCELGIRDILPRALSERHQLACQRRGLRLV